MGMTPELAAAIEVFRELGWEQADPATVLTLPLGTPQQRRIAKVGLAKGEWGDWVMTEEGYHRWQLCIDVDQDLLGAFAVRVGVPVRRAAALMPSGVRGFTSELRGALIAERGPSFAAAWGELGGPAVVNHSALVCAVTALGIEVPDNIEYLERWAAAVEASFNVDERRLDRIGLDILQTRYADHLRAALGATMPAPPAAASVVLGGVERGWIERLDAQELVLFAMEQAQRPGDRKAWAGVLTDTLGTSDGYLLDHAGVIVSTMSFGDDAIINRFAPLLLGSGDDELIAQAMLIGLTAKSAKAKALLLEAAAAIPPPSPQTRLMVGDAVAELLGAKDRRVAKFARKLIETWALDVAPPPPEAPLDVRGLWRRVPVLLSTPSWQDWRIDPAELLDRLGSYAAAGQPVLESDLQLALPRLDLELISEALAERLRACDTRILLQDASLAAPTVGQVLELWIEHPMTHPGFETETTTMPAEVKTVPALAQLPPRLGNPYLWASLHVFPTWPNARIPSCDGTCAALRAHPNGTAASTQLLDNIGGDAFDLGVTIAAWHHGRLHPGIADAKRLASNGQIASLAARAAGWSELAEAGLLSVVWPLADETIAFASRGARVSPGVAELVELLARYLPEARAAVENSLAGAEALALPGVRALAERGGSSKAVQAARKLVALLPPAPKLPTTAVADSAAMSDAEFAAAWPALPDPAVVDDGASYRLTQVAVGRGSRVELEITLTDGSVHSIKQLSWLYPLIWEQQVMLGEYSKDPTWLRYSASRQALVTSKERNDESRRVEDQVLTHTLAIALFASQLCTEDPPEHYFYSDCAQAQVGPRRTTAVIDDLLTHENADPYRLVRGMQRYPAALPALYPVLTRSIHHAAQLPGKPPRWLVRIIDVATEAGPVLRAAAARGFIAPEHAGWPGLAELAASSASPTVKKKAALLQALLDLA